MEKTEKEYLFTLQYKPIDYVTLLEIRNSDSKISKIEFDSTRKHFEGMSYFTLSIKNNKTDQELTKYLSKDTIEAEKVFNYFNFDMQNDLKLISGTDTLSCVLFHYEHNYGISPISKFLLGFKSMPGQPKTDITVLYEDKELHCGILQFKFLRENIAGLPSIDI